MRVLGVDLGKRRIGLAVSDPDAAFAFPHPAIASAGLHRDIEALKRVIEEQHVDRVVVGLPLHMNGRAGAEADAAKAFARALADATGLLVDTIDERWTTREAERALQAGATGRQRRRSRKSGERDSLAATIILRTWLERQRARAATPSDGEDASE